MHIELKYTAQGLTIIYFTVLLKVINLLQVHYNGFCVKDESVSPQIEFYGTFHPIKAFYINRTCLLLLSDK